jgi:hypothetical protein
MGPYDVFITHCGADCKRDFAVWLLTVLNTVGLCCFFDDRSLEPGDAGEKEMLEALRTAKCGIVILSAGFFKREWCMKELQTFGKRGRILPVFLGTFSQVQQAREAGISNCEWKTFKQFVRTEDEYRQAAEVSTDHTGLKLESLDGYWDTLIYKIRDVVLGLLGKDKGGPPISEVGLFLGQEEHLVKLKELLGVQGPSKASDGAVSTVVGIVRVKGMGGIGKSTIAKKLYDDPDVRECFPDGRCWLEVGEKPTDDKIRDLQKQIIKKICDLDAHIANPTEGRMLIRQRLSGKKVLIFLDDCWEKASIATPIVDIGALAAGSGILITSRNRKAIDARGTVHEMDVLSPPLAWKLFRWHAFGGDDPHVSIADTAKQAAERCGGLPLALELAGKQVRSAADKMECLVVFLQLGRDADPMIDARRIIKFSVDRLPSEPSGLQEVFVLIAAIWPSTPEFRDHGRALQNIGAAVYGGHPGSGVQEEKASTALGKLWDLSLVGSARGELLSVHDLIVDVAEGMKESFWGHYTVSSGMHSVDWHSVASLVIANSSCLVNGSSVVDSPCRLLSIYGYQRISFRHLGNLECLRLHELKIVPRPGWPFFTGLLRTKLLTRRLLKGIMQLKALRILEVDECPVLRSLPRKFGQLTGLTTLDLSACRTLKSLPEGIGQLTGLTTLGLSGCRALQRLPEQIGQLTGLTTLDLSLCSAL